MGRIRVNQSGPPNTQNDAKNRPTTDPEPFASFGVFGGYSIVLSVLSVNGADGISDIEGKAAMGSGE